MLNYGFKAQDSRFHKQTFPAFHIKKAKQKKNPTFWKPDLSLRKIMKPRPEIVTVGDVFVRAKEGGWGKSQASAPSR